MLPSVSSGAGGHKVQSTFVPSAILAAATENSISETHNCLSTAGPSPRASNRDPKVVDQMAEEWKGQSIRELHTVALFSTAAVL